MDVVSSQGHGCFSAKATLCDHYDEECQEIVESLFSRPFSIKKNQLFVRDDERVSTTFMICSGWAAHELVLPDGSRQITELFLPGDLFPVHAAMSGVSNSARIVALSDCRVTSCSSQQLKLAAAGHANLARTLWWLTQRDVSILRTWIAINGHYQGYERMAHLLSEILYRLEQVGLSVDGAFEFPPTQHDLADITGITPVHTNRVLQLLRKDKLIDLQRKQLEVCDRDKLEKAARFDPAYLLPA